jgi:hypothetical protein
MPPSKIKLLAALLDLPIPLSELPLARVDTDKVPPLILVTPVYVFAPVKVRVPEPDLVTALAPEMT